MIWLQKFGSDSPASELNGKLVLQGGGNQEDGGHDARSTSGLGSLRRAGAHTHCSRCAPGLGNGESGLHRVAASPIPRDGGPFPGGAGHPHQGLRQVRRAAFGDASQGHTLFHGINIYFSPWYSATPKRLLPFLLSSFPASLSHLQLLP